jgi:type III secretory pathway component EscS
LEPKWLTQLGFAARDFWEIRWGRLLTAALVTLGGGVFWQAMGMVMLAVGLAEYLTGSRRALATFWGVHVATLLAEGVIVGPLLHWFIFDGNSLLLLARDVGPSAGYFGALGLAVAALPWPRCWRGMVASAIFIGLLLTLFQAPASGDDRTLKLLADVAHVLAFPLGVAAWWLGNPHLALSNQQERTCGAAATNK